jgi:hypothetical protein
MQNISGSIIGLVEEETVDGTAYEVVIPISIKYSGGILASFNPIFAVSPFNIKAWKINTAILNKDKY